MRLFLAFPNDVSAAQRLSAIQTRLDAGGVPGRLVPETQWHVTAVFLGERAPDEVDGVCRITAAAWRRRQGHVPDSVPLDRITTFPPGRNPRVLVLAGRADDRWQRWHRDLARALDAPRSASLIPHVTLVRLGGERLPTLPRDLLRTPVEWPLSRLVLYHSTLTPSGPRYAPLATWPEARRPRAD